MTVSGKGKGPVAETLSDKNMEPAAEILIVDDEEGIRFVLGEALRKDGYSFETAGNGREALRKMESGKFKIVLMDIKMPGLDGLRTLEEIKARVPEVLVILMTAFGSKNTAIETLRKGAYDYFTKPFDLDEMRIVVRRALERCRLQEEIESLKRQVHGGKFQLLGDGPAMKKVSDLIRKVASNEATVLISGESGTGKELVARAIHDRSPRRNGPFQSVNCAGIPLNLLEAELFGHEKGAFTGAHQRRSGKFELADGGTLFLDEIGEMNEVMQAKILRMLQEREIEPLGGGRPLPINIRILSATNRDLPEAVQEKKFREDLFYRLNVVNIHLPPLRNRREDIPILAEFFLKRHGKELSGQAKRFSRRAIRWLGRQAWPGNVRELENVIQRAVVLSNRDILDQADFQEAVRGRDKNGSGMVAAGGLHGELERVSADVEKNLIERALKDEGGRKGAAAQRLGISRKHLYNKIKKYGMG